jgi:hypothetical protein
MSAFNPKMLAHDIAKGLMSLNPTSLKKYKPGDLKTILNHLSAAQREIRAKQIPLENMMEIKERNRQLQNINHAIMIVNGYIKKHRIQI